MGLFDITFNKTLQSQRSVNVVYTNYNLCWIMFFSHSEQLGGWVK